MDHAEVAERVAANAEIIPPKKVSDAEETDSVI